jgi:uncharacterized protein YjiS (DUF1127 family)
MIMGMISTAPVAAQTLRRRSLAREAGVALGRLWVAYMTWRIEQQAMAALAGMSDRELKDIGLTRTAIPAAVRGAIVRDRMISRYY